MGSLGSPVVNPESRRRSGVGTAANIMRRKKRTPRIVERRLFGEDTCGNGMCRYPDVPRDATVLVALPAIRFEYDRSGRPTGREIPVWCERWYCGECAAKELAGTLYS